MHDLTVKKLYNRTFFALFSTSFVWQISYVLDTMLSGSLFNTMALTGVGLAATYLTIMYLVMIAFSIGCSVCYGNELGRGNYKKANEFLTMTIILIVVIGAAISIFTYCFAPQISYVMGIREPEVEPYATIYIRFIALSVIPYGLNYVLGNIILLFGDRKNCFINNTLFMVVNLPTSLLLVKVMGMGVEGLAYGTLIGYVACMIHLLVLIIIKYKGRIYLTPINLKDALYDVKTIFIHAIPIFGDYSTDSIACIILNNVVAFFAGEVGLTVLAIVYSMRVLILVVYDTIDWTISTIASVLYGAHDTDGLRQILKSTFKLGLLGSFVMTFLMFIFRTPLMLLFGVENPELMIYITPYLIALIFISAIYSLTFMEAAFYNNTDNILLGTICAVLPDTVFYIPITTILMIPMGINSLWAAEFVANILFQTIMLLIISHRIGHFPKSLDDFMMLPKDYYDDKTLLSMSVNNLNGATNIAEQVQIFLNERGSDKKKAYYAALAIEEMATIIMNNSVGKNVTTDIAVFMNGQNIKVALRDNGEERNYLLSEGEDTAAGIGIKLLRGTAQKVRYLRLVDINMLNIEL